MGGGSVEVLPAADFANAGGPLDEAAAEQQITGNVWLSTDLARLQALLPASNLPAACRALTARVPPAVPAEDRLAAAVERAAHVVAAKEPSDEPFLPAEGAWKGVEVRYMFLADWDVRAHELSSKKGTWLKPSVDFSWEIPDAEKLYVAPGVVVPVRAVALVPAAEQGKHQWAPQHRRVWLQPTVLQELERQQKAWYMYEPHWIQRGGTIIATQETFLKRTCQMSWDLREFEKVKVAPQTVLRVLETGPVVAPWETCRHQHVEKHRRIVLDNATVQREP